MKQNAGVSNIEITDGNIKSFERVARKYGVDFALKKDTTSQPPRYLVFFKSRDADALTAAFAEYSGKVVKRQSQEKPSVRRQLTQFQEVVRKMAQSLSRNKQQEVTRRTCGSSSGCAKRGCKPKPRTKPSNRKVWRAKISSSRADSPVTAATN